MCSCQLSLQYLSSGKVVFIWSPYYQSAHWLFLCLRKTKLWNFKYLSFTAMYEAYIIITTLLLQSLSFAPALLFFSSPSYLSFYYFFRQIWKPPDLRPAFQEIVSTKAIWRGSLSPLSFVLSHPSLCLCFTPSGVCWRPETILEGHTVWFCCQFKLCLSFYI